MRNVSDGWPCRLVLCVLDVTFMRSSASYNEYQHVGHQSQDQGCPPPCPFNESTPAHMLTRLPIQLFVHVGAGCTVRRVFSLCGLLRQGCHIIHFLIQVLYTFSQINQYTTQLTHNMFHFTFILTSMISWMICLNKNNTMTYRNTLAVIVISFFHLSFIEMFQQNVC